MWIYSVTIMSDDICGVVDTHGFGMIDVIPLYANRVSVSVGEFTICITLVFAIKQLTKYTVWFFSFGIKPCLYLDDALEHVS